MNITTKIIISGILLVLVAATGMGLSAMGRPLNIALNTVHKLLALGFTVFTAIYAVGLIKSTGLSTSLLLLAIASAVFIIALFATGAVLSSDKPAAGVIIAIHRIVPALAAISSAILIYLLVKK